MNPVMILKWLEIGQMAFPALMNLISHYTQLKDDPALSETDKETMVKNLQALQLKDWESL